MSTKTDSALSIRRRLLLWLAIPATLILLAGTASDYFWGIDPVRGAYDRALADGALSIAAHVHASPDSRIRVRLPDEAIEVLRSNSSDSIYFRVSAPDGSFLAGDPDLPHPPPGASNPSFHDSMFRGHPIRLASYRSTTRLGTVTTVVAETLNKRRQIHDQLLSGALSVDLLELAAILALLWLGIGLALKPLQALREQLARRSARALDPIDATGVPAEVSTLVTELNRLFATLTDSRSAQRQFLQSAAHQLRTPLTGMQAQLELLISEEPTPARRERLAYALSATQRLSHTTQQLLALARSEHTTAMDADFRAVDLAEVAEASVADHVSRAAAAGIDLGAELAPAVTEGIAWLLKEAVNNLVDNALTYTPSGGVVTVRTGLRDGAAFLEVLDTGVGIPAEERAQVTDRFYRGRQSRGTGSGLGLAIVGDVARLHDAVLSIESGADGQGTCVRLEFL